MSQQEKMQSIQDEIDRKQQEMQQLKHDMWLEDMFHPKPEQRSYWQEHPENKKGPYRTHIKEMYTPTTEEMISRYIVTNSNDDYEVHFKHIDQLLAIERPELEPHKIILREYLLWFQHKSISMSQYLEWQPKFAKYGFKMWINSDERRWCALCNKIWYGKNTHVKIFKSESNENGYDGHHYETTHSLQIVMDTPQETLHRVTLYCDEKVWDEKLAEAVKKVYAIPQNIPPLEVASKCGHLQYEIEYFSKKDDNLRIHSTPYVEYLCQHCIDQPDWTKINFGWGYEWIAQRTDAIHIVKKS